MAPPGDQTSEDFLTEGLSLANPLQTFRIECTKEERRCTEARASVAGTVLLPEFLEYDVESWTTASIVLRKDFPCATEGIIVNSPLRPPSSNRVSH